MACGLFTDLTRDGDPWLFRDLTVDGDLWVFRDLTRDGDLEAVGAKRQVLYVFQARPEPAAILGLQVVDLDLASRCATAIRRLSVLNRAAVPATGPISASTVVF
jgi:hypothetical protein